MFVAIGIVGLAATAISAYQLLGTNAEPATAVYISESDCHSDETIHRLAGSFVSPTVLAVILSYQDRAGDPVPATGCALQVEAGPRTRGGQPAQLVTAAQVDGGGAICDLSRSAPGVTGGGVATTVLTPLEEELPAMIAFCVSAPGFRRSFDVLEYSVFLMERAPDGPDGYPIVEHADVEVTYRAEATEMWSVLPAADPGETRVRVTDERRRGQKDVLLFGLAAVFGASFSAILEAMLAFGHQRILHRIEHGSSTPKDV